MDLITVREIYRDRDKFLGKEIQIGGWVRSIRDSKTFGFIVVSDGSYFDTLQVVYHDNMENFNEISKLNVGAAILVKGTLVATPEAKQPFEIQASEVTVEGMSSPDYPLQKKRHSLEYLRTISHLRPRTNTFQAVFRVRSLIAYAIHHGEPGDIIVLAGKGHEDYQEIRGRKYPMDERVLIREILEADKSAGNV